MLLRIQKNETLRSFVERSLFIPNAGLSDEAVKALSAWNWNSYHVKLIAKLLGWHGCYGFNKLLHGHTIYPCQSVLKSRFNQSYSDDEYISDRTVFAALSAERSYCPVCAREDKLKLGYSYWRRTFPGVKVCAKHNVLLLSACQFCDKPFARTGHVESVMWTGCAGRHLGEAVASENHDPSALRFAQFFDDLCQADHHIYIDTAAVVLENRLIEKFATNPSAQLGNITIEEFKRYIECREIHDVIYSCRYDLVSSNLVEIAEPLYESFSEFAADCRKLDANSPVINSFWQTYCCLGQRSEHFIKENYRLGVAEWSWPAFNDYGLPFVRDLSVLMWGTGKYHCCIPPGAPHSKDNPIYAPHPRIPHLAPAELIAMSE